MPLPLEESLSRAIGAGLLHLIDPDRLRATAAALALLWQAAAWREERRQLLLLLAERTDRRLHPLPRAGPRPLPVPLGRPEHHHRLLPHLAGVSEPFRCLGFARYVSHEGERPMAIRWRLERAIPAGWMQGMGLAV